MERQLQASGDFAWAYVIAHEVGHHVQQQLGTSDEVNQIRRSDPDQRERGVGPARAAGRLLRRRLGAHGVRRSSTRATSTRRSARQRRSATTGCSSRPGRRVDPDSFTHGSSAQRRAWFERGRERGEPADCDTFSAESL